MSSKYITTPEIIEKGFVLNEKHRAYLNADEKERPDRWKEFYAEWQEYRAEVQAYIKTNPIDVSDAL